MLERVKKILKKLKKIKIPFIIFMVFCLLYVVIISITTINSTESTPLGVYILKPTKKYKKGEYITFYLDDKYKPFLEKDIDLSKNKIVKLIKPIAAMKGDHVKMINDEIYLNNKLVGYRLKLKGLDNPTIDKVLDDNEFIVLSKNHLSLDSRYLGIIHKKDILAKYVFLTDFNIESARNINTKIFGKDYKKGVELK